MADFNYVTSQLGNVKPELRQIAKELFDVAAANGHEIWYMWGFGGGQEHGSGMALDLMVRTEAAGDFLHKYIWDNRSRLRLIHEIWEQSILSTQVSPGVRRKMEDRGSVTNNHYDHVHVWFSPGTYVAPGGASTPPVSETGTQRLLTYKDGTNVYMSGEDVRRLQGKLKKIFPAYAGNLVVDGEYGPATKKVVQTFQTRVGITPDGDVGPITWGYLARYGIS